MTDRRDFIRRLTLGVAAFYVLPSATTYQRVWRPTALNRIMWWHRSMSAE